MIMTRRILAGVILLTLALMPPTRAEYKPIRAGDPDVRAIFSGNISTRAWIYYQGQRYHVVPGMRLDNEWRVEDIRRNSVLFRRTSTGSYVDMPLRVVERSRYHRECSFLGLPIGLWEALELTAQAFRFHVVMQHQAGGTVKPGIHGNTLEEMLHKFLPRHHRFALFGPVLAVLPVHPAGEQWSHVLKRRRQQRPADLCIRFPGLNKPGSLISRGDDIHYVLRQIALGGTVPIQFPRDLHFPVYAYFRDVPFSEMLVNILYINQCIIIERSDALEIQPWPRHIQPILTPPNPAMVTAGTQDPQPGWGPAPPPPQDTFPDIDLVPPPFPAASAPLPANQAKDSF